MTDTIQTINLADNINAAFDKINENFELLTVLDSAQVRAIITGSDLDMGGNKVLFANVYLNESELPDAGTYHGMFAHVHETGKAYFAHDGQWVEIGAGNGSFDTSDIDSDINANTSAILSLESRIDSTESGITVLSQAQIATQAQLDSMVLGGIDSDLLASAIANANSTIISRIDANSDGITSFAGVIDSVENDMLLRDSATNDLIEINTSAISALTSRIDVNSDGLTAVLSSVDSLGLSLNQLITDGIDTTPEQVQTAIGGALDELTLRLDADSDKLILEAQKIVDLDAQLTALDSETGELIEAEADARNVLSATVALIDGRVTSQSTDITNLTASVDSDFARIDNELTTIVDDLGNASAVYALNLDVNNHIAGIRLDNDGNTANFAVTADTFKIINASDNEIQPFTVQGNQVELSNATVTGGIDVTTSDSDGSMNIKGNLITIEDGQGNVRVKLGKLV